MPSNAKPLDVAGLRGELDSWANATREAFGCDEDAPVEPQDIHRLAAAVADEDLALCRENMKRVYRQTCAALAEEDEERTLIQLEIERAALAQGGGDAE